MTIYEPFIDESGLYSGGTGKDVGYGKSPQLFKPQFQTGGSRIGAIAKGLSIGIGFVGKHYKFFTGIGVVAAGAAIRHGTSKNQFGKAYSSAQSKYNRRTKYKQSRTRKCCCTVRNTHQSTRRNNRYRR